MDGDRSDPEADARDLRRAGRCSPLWRAISSIDPDRRARLRRLARALRSRRHRYRLRAGYASLPRNPPHARDRAARSRRARRRVRRRSPKRCFASPPSSPRTERSVRGWLDRRARQPARPADQRRRGPARLPARGPRRAREALRGSARAPTRASSCASRRGARRAARRARSRASRAHRAGAGPPERRAAGPARPRPRSAAALRRRDRPRCTRSAARSRASASTCSRPRGRRARAPAAPAEAPGPAHARRAPRLAELLEAAKRGNAAGPTRRSCSSGAWSARRSTRSCATPATLFEAQILLRCRGGRARRAPSRRCSSCSPPSSRCAAQQLAAGPRAWQSRGLAFLGSDLPLRRARFDRRFDTGLFRPAAQDDPHRAGDGRAS